LLRWRRYSSSSSSSRTKTPCGDEGVCLHLDLLLFLQEAEATLGCFLVRGATVGQKLGFERREEGREGGREGM